MTASHFAIAAVDSCCRCDDRLFEGALSSVVFVGVAARGGEPDCCGDDQCEKLSCDVAHRSNETEIAAAGCGGNTLNAFRNGTVGFIDWLDP